jgi:hypothetical protein
MKQTFSSLDISNNNNNLTSPTSTKFIDADQMRTDADATPSHLFTSPNSFFSNGHKGNEYCLVDFLYKLVHRFCTNKTIYN